MDVNNTSTVFVAKNCARTATIATEVADGLTIPIGSVQASIPTLDNGNSALSYYGPGELIITSPPGIALDAATAVKAIPSILIKQRSYNGASHYGSMPIKGDTIRSYQFTPYKAKSEQTTILDGIDASLTSHPYMIKIRRFGSENNKLKDPTVKTAYFKSSASGNTAEEIVDGWVAYINSNFNTDPIMPLVASKGGAASDALIIQALPLAWELGKFDYGRLEFTVELVNFDGTLQDNRFADLLHNAITYDHATLGAGSYEQVAEMEFFAKPYTGANSDVAMAVKQRTIVPMDAQPFEDDGTTPNRYDTIVINWVDTRGNFQQGIRQEGSIIFFLPLDDNTTNQQDDILDTLNKYIVTEYGVGATIVLS